MVKLPVVGIVDFCIRHRGPVLAGGLLLAIVCGAYSAARFSINTDIEALISQDLPWHARQIAYAEAFPQQGISAVVTARTPEDAQRATNMLAQELARHPDLFRKVVQPDSGEFFERNGLLFQSL